MSFSQSNATSRSQHATPKPVLYSQPRAVQQTAQFSKGDITLAHFYKGQQSTDQIQANSAPMYSPILHGRSPFEGHQSHIIHEDEEATLMQQINQRFVEPRTDTIGNSFNTSRGERAD